MQQIAKVAEILIASETPSQIDKKLMVLCADDDGEIIAERVESTHILTENDASRKP